MSDIFSQRSINSGSIAQVIAILWSCFAASHAAESAPSISDEQIATWIEQLGDERYALRMQAENSLRELGVAAADALQNAEEHSDQQIAKTARYLLRSNAAVWYSPDDDPQARKLLERFSDATLSNRSAIIDQLASLPEDAGVAALARIARFTSESDLSRRAALKLMALTDQNRTDEQLRERWRTVMQAISDRDSPPCRWLRQAGELTIAASSVSHSAADPLPLADQLQWLKIFPDNDYLRPPTGWLAWQRSTLKFQPERLDQAFWQQELADELELLNNQNPHTSTVTIQGLKHFVLKLLVRADRRSDAVELHRWMRKQAEQTKVDLLEDPSGEINFLLDYGLPEVVIESIEAALDPAADPRSAMLFDSQLRYRLAEAHRWLGNEEEARKQAAMTLEQNRALAADERLEIAAELGSRIMYDWAENEYLDTTKNEITDSSNFVRVYSAYAQFLLDGQEYEKSAEAMKKTVERWENDSQLQEQSRRWSIGEIFDTFRSTYHHCAAKAAMEKGDIASAKSHMQEGLDASFENVDIVIDMYRIEDDDPEWQKTVQNALEQSVRFNWQAVQDAQEKLRSADQYSYASYRQDYANTLNTYAWLIVNIGRSSEQALKLSQLSNRLRPGSSAYMDTLARCHWVRGEVVEAEQLQFRAWSIEPHSRQLLRTWLEYRDSLLQEPQGN